MNAVEGQAGGWSRMNGRRVALVLAHPGHELRLHGCLERLKPRVYILTDGSGHAARSRLDQSLLLLQATGANPGNLFGRFTDRALYALLMSKETAIWPALAETLAADLLANGIDTVIADGFEGFNPAHDLCRLLAEAAVTRLQSQGRPVTQFAFPLDGPPSGQPAVPGPEALVLPLTPAELARKRAAALNYPALAGDIQLAVNRYGWEGFESEWLFPAGQTQLPPPGWRPYYEIHGEHQVESGVYDRVLRYKEQFRPAAYALRAAAEREA